MSEQVRAGWQDAGAASGRGLRELTARSHPALHRRPPGQSDKPVHSHHGRPIGRWTARPPGIHCIDSADLGHRDEIEQGSRWEEAGGRAETVAAPTGASWVRRQGLPRARPYECDSAHQVVPLRRGAASSAAHGHARADGTSSTPSAGTGQAMLRRGTRSARFRWPTPPATGGGQATMNPLVGSAVPLPDGTVASTIVGPDGRWTVREVLATVWR